MKYCVIKELTFSFSDHMKLFMSVLFLFRLCLTLVLIFFSSLNTILIIQCYSWFVTYVNLFCVNYISCNFMFSPLSFQSSQMLFQLSLHILSFHFHIHFHLKCHFRFWSCLLLLWMSLYFILSFCYSNVCNFKLC